MAKLAPLKNILLLKKPRWIAALLLIIFLGLVIRACTNSGDGIQVNIIGQDIQWVNLNLVGKERNLSAFNNDLLSAISQNEGIRILPISAPNQTLMDKLNAGDIQGMITSLQPNSLYQGNYLFSNPYFLLGPVLVISSAAPVAGWNEMSRKIVGIPVNSPLFGDLEKDTSVQIKIYDTILPALVDLNENRIDGVIFPGIPSYVYTHTFYEGKLKIATTPLSDEGLRLVVQNNEHGQQLVTKFNQGLRKLKENGTYDQLLARWGLVNIEKVAEK